MMVNLSLPTFVLHSVLTRWSTDLLSNGQCYGWWISKVDVREHCNQRHSHGLSSIHSQVRCQVDPSVPFLWELFTPAQLHTGLTRLSLKVHLTTAVHTGCPYTMFLLVGCLDVTDDASGCGHSHQPSKVFPVQNDSPLFCKPWQLNTRLTW